MNLKSGLVSITFRKKSPQEIVEMVADAGLEGIEWGGDVHVPHGDLAAAREVRGMCESRGIAIPSYGSYYRAGVSEEEGLSFSAVLNTASELDTDLIRIWAGKASADISDEERELILKDILRVAKLAADKNIAIGLEFHSGTLTDSNESSSLLLEELGDSDNVFLYWQPRLGDTPDKALDSLSLVAPRLGNIHVFHWTLNESGERKQRHLSEGESDWRRYLAAVETFGKEINRRYVMLEFVRDGSPGQFAEDAETLRSILTSL
ncbi:MAG: sugar phosphate isomerase/epimerase [Victivallales bacterium]|nr:sugar phosphate isomerase/epimerase [Victivallales bacterium]